MTCTTREVSSFISASIDCLRWLIFCFLSFISMILSWCLDREGASWLKLVLRCCLMSAACARYFSISLLWIGIDLLGLHRCWFSWSTCHWCPLYVRSSVLSHCSFLNWSLWGVFSWRWFAFLLLFLSTSQPCWRWCTFDLPSLSLSPETSSCRQVHWSRCRYSDSYPWLV